MFVAHREEPGPGARDQPILSASSATGRRRTLLRLPRFIRHESLIDTPLECEQLPIFKRTGGTIAQMPLLQSAQRSGGSARQEPELLAAQHRENSARLSADRSYHETRGSAATLHDTRSRTRCR